LPPRRTIARPAVIRGAGLHEGIEATLTLRPAEAGSGLRFVRTDLPGTAPIPVDVARASAEMRRTQIAGPDGAEVHTIEHLMAAVSGRGITDLLCEIDRVETPGMDGSARLFDEAIVAAGVTDLAAPAPTFVLDRTVVVTGANGARIVASPSPGRLTVGYLLDYGTLPEGGHLFRQRAEVTVTEETWAGELAPARTFALEQEALFLKAAGFGKGATTENTLIVRGDGSALENTFRFPNECARHKALDVLGDLTLLGVRLEAHVVAWKGGHGLNADLVRALRAVMAEAGSGGGVLNTETQRAQRHTERDGGGGATIEGAPASYDPPPVVVDGHFPGDPVVPGIAMLAALRAGADIAAIEGAKFRRVVRPGERLTLERTPGAAGKTKVRASAGSEPALDAVMISRDAPAPGA